MSAETTIQVTAGYGDYSTRKYDFGKFNDDSTRLGEIVQHPKTELAKLTPFLNKTISANGAPFSEIQEAQITSIIKEPIPNE